MGYAHCYRVEDWSSPEWQAAWPQLIQDTSTIIDAVPDIPLFGPCSVTFEEGRDIPNPPIANVDDGICINDVEEDSYEDFILKESEPRGSCKTGRRAYDMAVACVLLRAYRLAPNTFQLIPMGTGIGGKNGFRHEHYIMDLWPNDPDDKPLEIDEGGNENE